MGPNGQHGLVEDVCSSGVSLNQEVMYASRIGKHMSAKWDCGKCRGMPDMSDAASFLVLMGYGGGLAAFPDNGTVANQEKMNRLLCESRADMFAKLEERAKVAAGTLKK